MPDGALRPRASRPSGGVIAFRYKSVTGKGFGGLHHDYEVMAYTVGLYTHYIRSLRRAVADMEAEVAEHEQSLALMGVDYSKGAGSGPSRDKLPDGVISLVKMRERLIDEHGRCDADAAHAR